MRSTRTLISRRGARVARDVDAHVAVLAACFHAFGGAPPGGVIVMAYFTGLIGNLLPLPGGRGGVEGGMIGAFLSFGVDAGLAAAVVLSYRAFAYRLPMIRVPSPTCASPARSRGWEAVRDRIA